MAIQHSSILPMMKHYIGLTGWRTVWPALWASFGIFSWASVGSPSLTWAVEVNRVTPGEVTEGRLRYSPNAYLGSNSITDIQFLTQRSNTQLYASSTLLFVNPSIGDDEGGDGSQRSPLRTLTRALTLAQSGTVVMLAPGSYTAENGEQFPLQLKSGITVQGDPSRLGQGVLIQGGGRFLSPTFAGQDVTMLGADEAVLTGVTITNPNGRGYGLWIESASPTVVSNTFIANVHDGVSITGDSRPTIQGNHFYRNGANGITIYGTSQPNIQGNVFEETGFGINMAKMLHLV